MSAQQETTALTARVAAITGLRRCAWCMTEQPVATGRFLCRGKRNIKSWCCKGCLAKKGLKP